MKVVVLHTKDAVDGEEDPVLGQLEQALRNGDHEPRRVMVDAAVEPVVQELTSDRPDLVINLAESFAGKSALESSVASLLNLLDLRYTGSSPAGLMVAGDKTLSKKVLLFHGIKTPQFATVYRGMVDWAGDVNFPLIVKPPQEDASLGITHKSIVRDVKELLEQIAELQSEYQQPALAEQFVEGREFYVGVLGNANARALPVIELDFSGFPCGSATHRQLGSEVGRRGRRERGRVRGHGVDLSRRTCLTSCARRCRKSQWTRFTRCVFATTRVSTCGSRRRAMSTSSRSIRTATSRRRASSRELPSVTA